MNARKRMLAAIQRRPVNRAPTDIWATPAVWAMVRTHFGSEDGTLAGLLYDEFYAPHHKRFIDLCHEFGVRVFHIDNQHVMPFGRPGEVRAAVRHGIDTLASDKTGCMLAPCHNLQGHTPLANILAMYDEAWQYGTC